MWGNQSCFPIPVLSAAFHLSMCWTLCQALTQSCPFPEPEGTGINAFSGLELRLHGSSKPRATAQAACAASVKTRQTPGLRGRRRDSSTRVAGGGQAEGRVSASVPLAPADSGGPAHAGAGGGSGPRCARTRTLQRGRSWHGQPVCARPRLSPGTRRTFLGSGGPNTRALSIHHLQQPSSPPLPPNS